MDATKIKLLFKENSPSQFAQRSLMIRRPEKMKVRTFSGDYMVWPTLNKKHQVLLLGPKQEKSGKLVMTDEDAKSIFQKIGYNYKNIYLTPKGGLVVFVQDFHPRFVEKQEKQQKQQKQEQQSSLISPIPIYTSGKGRKRSSSTRPSTPLLMKQLY